MADRTKRATIYDVANEAHVSVATVSRVMNNLGTVNEETKAAVDNAIKKLGYIPSSIARGLAMKTTTNIAIVLPSPNYNYISSIMSGMLDVVKIYGYNASLFTYENPDDATKVVDKVISAHMEGIVCFNSELSAADLHKMVKLQIPMVLIGRDNYGNNCLVDMKYSSTLKETIERFVKRGLKHIVYLKDPKKDWHMVSTFENSIVEGMGKSDARIDTLSIEDSYKPIYEYFMDKFKKEKPNHELYITVRDSVATAIVNAAYDSNIKVPDDLEVLGVIGTKSSIITRPMISSIEADLYQIGIISMRMLQKMLENRMDTNYYEFSTTYKKRGSTID